MSDTKITTIVCELPKPQEGRLQRVEQLGGYNVDGLLRSGWVIDYIIDGGESRLAVFSRNIESQIADLTASHAKREQQHADEIIKMREKVKYLESRISELENGETNE